MDITENAYAKINLYLDVIRRRQDGFHDIESIMHTVSLCDTIRLCSSPAEEGSIHINSNVADIPNGESNLIYKSALKYMQKFDITDDITIELTKVIPVGAGLGGGSADAAATLRAMNKIYGFATSDQLLEIGAEIGSDVPFCINGGCAACTGRGEQISALTFDNAARNVVVAIGEERISTPSAYALLDDRYGDFSGRKTVFPLDDMQNIPIGYNIFESVIDLEEIQAIKKKMIDNNAECTLMSGSGPSVFCLLDDEITSLKVKEELENAGFLAFACKLTEG